MAQTLLAFYSFNDNNTSSVKDFSINERHSSSVSNLTISTEYPYTVGKVGVFNGTNTTINFGNVSSLNALTAMSIVVRFKALGLLTKTISFRNGNHILELGPSDAPVLIWTLDTGSSYVLTDTTSLNLGQWYTAVFTWDGTDMKCYIDNSTVSSSISASGTTPTNSNNLYLGYDSSSDYMKGSLEMISYYSRALSTEEIDAIMESPSGLRFESNDSKLKTGDLVLNNAGGRECVVWYEEFDERAFSDSEYHLANDNEQLLIPN